MVKNPNAFPWKLGTEKNTQSHLFNIVIDVLASAISQEKYNDLGVYTCRIKNAWILFLPEDLPQGLSFFF